MFHIGAIAVPLNYRWKTAELMSILERVRPALYIGDVRLSRKVDGVDPSILALERRFFVGESGEDDDMQLWSGLLADETSFTPSVARDTYSPAVLVAKFDTAGIKFVAHTHAKLMALFGLPFLCGL